MLFFVLLLLAILYDLWRIFGLKNFYVQRLVVFKNFWHVLKVFKISIMLHFELFRGLSHLFVSDQLPDLAFALFAQVLVQSLRPWCCKISVVLHFFLLLHFELLRDLAHLIVCYQVSSSAFALFVQVLVLSLRPWCCKIFVVLLFFFLLGSIRIDYNCRVIHAKI